MKRVLVTGGAGFIGSHLVQALADRGDQVVVLDSFDPYYDPELKERNLAAVLDDIELVRGDIRDEAAVERAMRGVDCVVHLAARAGVRASLRDPRAYAQVNVEGSMVLLEAMRRLDVPQLVAASSSSVYGARHQGPFSEDDPLPVAASPYAATKRAMELLCETWQRLYGYQLTSLRFFTVYGPRQRPDMAIRGFTRKVLAGQPITLFGDGSSLRDYTYIDDIVAGVLAAVDRPQQRAVINLGNSSPVRLDQLVELLARALGREPEVRRTGDQPGDVPLTWADTSRAQQLLGYRAQVSLEEGLRRFVAWLEEE